MSFSNPSHPDRSDGIAVEWLEFQVPRDRQALFVEKDAEIWTSFLAQCSGFLSKEVLVRDSHPDTLFVIVRWASRAQWKAISVELLAETAERFDRALGERYEPIERACRVLHARTAECP